MKKSQLYDRSEALYVEELRTFEQIAAEVGCSERTLRDWAKEGQWETKRRNFRDQQERLSDDAREIAVLLAGKIKDQLAGDLEPSPHILNAFTRMASSLLRVREYDRALDQEAAAGDNSTADKDKEAVSKSFRQLFGADLEL